MSQDQPSGDTGHGGQAADRVALGWARPERGPAGRLAKALARRSGRFLRASLGLAARGGTALRGEALARLRDRGLADPERALRLLRLLPAGRLRAEGEALMIARARGWEAAAPLFAGLAGSGTPPGAAAGLLRPVPPAPALLLATPRGDRPVAIPPEAARRIAVYTARFGRAPDLPPVLGEAEGIRFLVFTDRPVSAPGWEVFPAAIEAGSPEACEAAHKIRPHAALAEAAPEAEWSLWLDPGMRLTGNLHTLVTRWLRQHDLALWRHPHGIDWHDLAERALLDGAPPGPVIAQAAAAARENTARDSGAADTGLIWRRHGAAPLRALAEAWWRREAEAPGADALSLIRAYRAPAPAAETPPLPRPAILPEALGQAGASLYAARIDRRAPRRHRNGPPSPPLLKGRIPVGFLYHSAHARTATTFLRGEQLSRMVADAFPDRLDVLYTPDPEALKGRVVIATKSALKTRGPEAIAALRRRNVLVIGSWDDVLPEAGHVAELDAHMTLSIGQTIALNRRYPDTPAFLVTHHVNPEVGEGAPPADRLRTAYFGDLINTIRPPSLGEAVDLVGIDTANVDGNTWLDALPRYNCHWIVRRPQPWNGWKPFLKGFVAARRGAAVIVTRDDGDALHYLGEDYPFFADSLAPADLEMAHARVAGAFGGPDWTRALGIMAQVRARSTNKRVAAEFRAMIEALAG